MATGASSRRRRTRITARYASATAASLPPLRVDPRRRGSTHDERLRTRSGPRTGVRGPFVVQTKGLTLGRARELHRRRLETLDGAEDDLVALGVDDDRLARVELLPQDLLRQRVLDVTLDGAAQRPGAQRRVVALLGEQVLRRIGELEPEALALQLRLHPHDEQVHDVVDVAARQLREHDDVVDAVEEFGPEVPLELL